MKNVVRGLFAGVAILAIVIAETPAQQPSPQPSPPETRALQSTIAELTQAWTGARTQMNAAQDMVAQLQQENQKLKSEVADLEKKQAKALPDASKPAEPPK